MSMPETISRESGVRDSKAVIEALLFASDAPLTPEKIREVVGDVEEAEIREAIESLRTDYRAGARAFDIFEFEGGYQVLSRPEFASWVERLFVERRKARLSRQALETLAIVAYLGPCSRPDIARIRGVAADSAVASLVERGLVTEAGREPGQGGAVRYRTTPLFERVFGLQSLAALPRLDDLGEEATELRERLLEVAEARAS